MSESDLEFPVQDSRVGGLGPSLGSSLSEAGGLDADSIAL